MSDTKIKITRAKREFWTLEKIKKGLELFYKEYSRYPTATEFNDYKHLPSSKTIERKFSGLIELRRFLNLEGQYDFREGKHSRARAVLINKRADVARKKVYAYLVEMFGDKFILQEHSFTDDTRTRVDFFVKHQKGKFSLDLLFPANRQNLNTSINTKINKFKDTVMLQYPVIFLQMNENISKEIVQDVVKNKKSRLIGESEVMCFQEFKIFANSLSPRK